MAYRMLLGRQALPDDILITPSSSFCQPLLGYEVYHSAAVLTQAPVRTLRVAILSREERTYTTRGLIEEGESRVQVVETIDTQRCYMAISRLTPEVHYDGKRLPHFDAVIPRIGASITPVSYTHLDVYKRQDCARSAAWS